MIPTNEFRFYAPNMSSAQSGQWVLQQLYVSPNGSKEIEWRPVRRVIDFTTEEE